MTVINDEDYTSETREDQEFTPQGEPMQSAGPEPPISWKPSQDQSESPERQQASGQGHMQLSEPHQRNARQDVYGIRLTNEQALLYESARKLASAAQICALVSLVIGGVVLSSVALALACMSLGRFSRLSDLRGDDLYTRQSMRFLARRALLLSIIALAINVTALILIYPMIAEMLQTGDASSFIGWGQGAGSANTGTSTWG